MSKTPPRKRVTKAASDDWTPSDLDRTTGGLHESREGILKAVFLGGGDRQVSNVMQGVDEAERRFHLAGAIEPPYNPITLAALIEHSNALRQNVDAYATNIDGFGHKFEPNIDLDADDADDQVSQALMLERQRMRADPNMDASVMALPLTPTPDEVAAKKRELEELMRLERIQIEHFFDNCLDDMSFVSLRRKLRQDLEMLGNAYFEVLRNDKGEIAAFSYIPGFTVRLLPLDKELTEVRARQRSSAIDYQFVMRRRQLRKYVQVFEAYAVYFKEFGDPRVVSKKSGKVFASAEELVKHDSSDGPATEVVHLKIHSSRTSYGVPRWIGNLLSVLGSRQAEEVNFMYFENKGVPPLALLVSGGRVSEQTVKRLEDYFASEIKGKKNFHKLAIIEATGAPGQGTTLENSGKMAMDLKPLTDAQNKDALFLNYDEKNIDKVGMSFRLPRLLRGDIRDFNRATAESALEFTEQQVFSPERVEFDFIINRKILAAMGVRFWKFVSMTPTTKDPIALAQIIKDLVLANVLTPEEGRELAGDVFNKDLAKIDAPWVKQPVPLTLAGIQPVDPEAMPWEGGPDDYLGPHESTVDGEKAVEGETPQVTRTALAHVMTVNEIRQQYGLGPKTTADGAADPHANLTVAEYLELARRRMGSLPEGEEAQKDVGGGDYGGSIAGNPPPATGNTLTVADLQSQGGLLALAQGRRVQRAPRRRRTVNDAVKQLVSIRNAMLQREADEAGKQFLLDKATGKK